jgi:DUF4097 and DUF4098 domain-containing protein YvlB
MKSILCHKNFACSFFALTLGCTLLFITGCGIVDPVENTHENIYQASSDFDYEIAAGPGKVLEISSINGPITVTGVKNSTTVHIWGVRAVGSDSKADAEAFLEKVEIELSESKEKVSVATSQPNQTNGRDVSIIYYARIPYDWSVKIENINGTCHVDSLGGDVSVKLTNGNTLLSDVHGNTYVTVTNGQIEGTLYMPANGHIQMRSTNGLIQLLVPQNTSAKLSASVTNGLVQVEGLQLTQSKGSRRSIEAIIGSGDGQIELATTNGNILVKGM